MPAPFHLIPVIALLLAAGLCRAETDKELAAFPEMSPEHCAELPPEQLYEKLTAEHPEGIGISSEAGHDYFCSIYQSQLQKFVDAKHPRAREYREPFTAAWLEMVHYIEEIYHHNMIKHLYERTSAEAEWAIYQAEKDNYKLWRGTGYDGVAIERVALVMADGNGRNVTFESQALPHLHEALRQFTRATTNEDGESLPFNRCEYLAHALLKFLTDQI